MAIGWSCASSCPVKPAPSAPPHPVLQPLAFGHFVAGASTETEPVYKRSAYPGWDRVTSALAQTALLHTARAFAAESNINIYTGPERYENGRSGRVDTVNCCMRYRFILVSMPGLVNGDADILQTER